MDCSHAGKIAIVTGGSRGIGSAIAGELVQSGARVIITGRREEALRRTADALGEACTPIVCHVADEDAAERCVRAVVETHGRVDALVNNVAVNPQWGPTLDVDAAMAAKMAEVNQWAPVQWSRLAYRASMREHGGSIVNITSLGGQIVTANTGYYNATKAALGHLTQALSAELAPQVRVNAVAPGLIDTEMARNLSTAERAELTAQVPLGRLGRPEDVAAATSFLLSDRAAWITGSTLVVDGGTRHHRGGTIG